MTELKNHPRTPRDYLRLFAIGLAMGIADLIPGVSGGTLAFILGVYEDLLATIKSFSLDVARLAVQRKFKAVLDRIPWQFGLTLFAGIAAAVVLLANVMSWLLENQRVFVFAFFFGLIIASILAIGARVKWSALTLGMVAAGTIVALLIVTRIPLDMPHDPLTLLLSGMVAIMAMILPGISGSFILLLLGQYDFVLNAVKNLDVLTILPVGIGSIIGLLGFARLLSWLLRRYEAPTVATLVGFMLGSLYKIWPWKVVIETRIDRHGEVVPLVEANIVPNLLGGEFWLALVICIGGFLLVSLLDHLQSKDNPVFRLVIRRRDIAPVKP